MDKIKRVLLINVPTTICNFRCSYCYLAQKEGAYKGEQAKMLYSPEQVAYALRPERLGGLAYMNFCAAGETLLSKNIDKYILELVKLGHYAEIVTNATITPVIDKILSWDKELLKHISFKCSFHYIELKKKNLLETFAANVNKMWAAGASANIEITPSDELIPMIDEVKEFSMRHFGALPHLTIARNDATDGIEYLTKLPIDEYDRIWGQFNSEFWKFKKSVFKRPIKEYCYAGDWSLYINIANGQTTQCYISNYSQNIFKNPGKPIAFRAVAKCKQPHCYNGHALLTLGCVPHFTDVKYGDIRNRIRNDGRQWIQPEVLSFFNSTLVESNKEHTDMEKMINRLEADYATLKQRLKRSIKRLLGRK